jgi:FOG: TPR repeat, SEL1 subfamily
MYLFGQGVPKYYDEALYWVKKSAGQGSARGENLLGYMYEHGLGVPQDYNKALYWYKKSAEQGFKPAENALKSLESKLKSDTITK